MGEQRDEIASIRGRDEIRLPVEDERINQKSGISGNVAADPGGGAPVRLPDEAVAGIDERRQLQASPDGRRRGAEHDRVARVAPDHSHQNSVQAICQKADRHGDRDESGAHDSHRVHPSGSG